MKKKIGLEPVTHCGPSTAAVMQPGIHGSAPPIAGVWGEHLTRRAWPGDLAVQSDQAAVDSLAAWPEAL